HAHRDLRHGVFSCPHQHNLDNTAFIDVGVERCLPLRIHGGLLLYQCLPSLCDSAGQRSQTGTSPCFPGPPYPSVPHSLLSLQPQGCATALQQPLVPFGYSGRSHLNPLALLFPFL
ncbi:mCG146247, partial [Mus musculus]